MSDDPSPSMHDDAPRPRPAGIYEHWCEHPGCKAWGGWGFQRHGAPVYFCFEHRADGEG